MEALVEDAQRAIVANDEDALRDAIRRGADVNGMVPCREKNTGARGHFPLMFLAVLKGLPGMCEILLAEGADANIPATRHGGCSLHHAATRHAPTRASAACMRLLLDAGADPNFQANDRSTPLHVASEQGRVDATTLLIAAGANLKARNREGLTPLRIAIFNDRREVALTLLRAGAPITVLPTKWIKPENEALQDYIIDIIDTGGWNARVERHRRPLMSILSNLALPHDALVVVLSFWSPPGGR